MPAYLGVSKKDILQSLNDAIVFYQKHSTGPEMDKHFEEWLKRWPLSKITAAKTDLELVKAIVETGTSGVFVQISNCLRHHAALDTDGLGQKIFENLSRWDAVYGTTFAVYTPLVAEKDCYLVKSYLSEAIHNVTTLYKNMAHMEDFLNEITQDDAVRQDVRDAVESAIDMGLQGKDYKTQSDTFFKAQDLHGRHVYIDLLGMLSGVTDKVRAVRGKGAKHQYGIAVAIDDMNDQTVWRKNCEKILDDIQPVIEKYRHLHEHEYTGFGFITKDRQQMGVMFRSTRRVAESVAKHVPELNVIDYWGNKIKGATNKSAQSRPAPKKPCGPR